MNMRDSFVLYKSFYEPVQDFSLEEKGMLFDAIFRYQIYGEEPKEPSGIKIAFGFFKNQFRVDDDKYSKIVERNRQNGVKGGRPIKNQENPTNPLGYLQTQETQSNLNENDNDNDNDNGEVNETFAPHFLKIIEIYEKHGVLIKFDDKATFGLMRLFEKYSSDDVLKILEKALNSSKFSEKIKNSSWGVLNFIERFDTLKKELFTYVSNYSRPVALTGGEPIPEHVKKMLSNQLKRD